MSDKFYVCKECGSKDVEQKFWVNLNTSEIKEECSSDEYDDQWCNSCQNNCLITTEDEYERNNNS